MSEYIGPYRLLKNLQSGQTCQVWIVINDKTHKRYAMKFLLSQHLKNREHIGVLKHEFEVGKSLKHPRIIQMVDFNYHQKAPYLVMELFPVPSLKQWISGKELEKIQPLMHNILAQSMDALAAFHEAGWLHRDIKPDNYLCNEEGELKLIDFGLAEKPKTGIMKFFSGKSKIQGTRSYMSPEQIRGETLEVRSDIYSFGCMIYELLTGSTPFVGTNSNDLLQKHLKSLPLPMSATNNQLTREVDDLVMSMLEKKIENRPKSMMQCLSQLKTMRIYR